MRSRLAIVCALLVLAALLVTFTAQPGWLGFGDSDNDERAEPRPTEATAPELTGRARKTDAPPVPENAPEPDGEPTEPGRLAGRVVDQDGAPISGASISAYGGRREADLVEPQGLRTRVLWTPPEPPFMVDSDADGRFVITGLGHEVFFVAHAPGYTTVTHRVVVPAAGVETTVRLHAVAALRGRVVRADGSGIAGVPVALLQDLNAEHVPYDEARTRTGADGSFRFDMRPRGSDLAVVAFVRGHPTLGKRIQPDEEEVMLVLQDDAQVTLRVLDAGRRGIRGVLVNVAFLPRGRGDSEWLPGDLAMHTNDRGEIDFKAPAGGELIVGFVHPSGATGWHAPGMLGGSVRGPEKPRLAAGTNVFEYTFPRLVALAGRVTDERGVPVADAVVRDVGQPFARTDNSAVSDAEGRYRIDKVAATSIQLEVKAEGFASVTDAARIPPDFEGTFEKDLRLERTHTVRGRVIDEKGAPLGGVRIRISDLGDPPYALGNFFDEDAREATTNAAGRYTLQAVAGRSFVVGRLPGRADAHAGPIKIESDVEAPDIVLKPGIALAVRVETPDGRLARGAGVQVAPDPSFHVRWLSSNYDDPPTLTATDGRIELRDLPAMTVGVLATHSQYAAGYVTHRVDPEKPNTVTVQLHRPVTLRGRVVDDEGKSVEGVHVAIGTGSPPGGHGTTDAKGKFAVERMRRGATVYATLDVRTYRHTIVELEVGDGPVEIVLTPLTAEQLATLESLSKREDVLYDELDTLEWGTEPYKAKLREFHDVQAQIGRLRGVPEDP